MLILDGAHVVLPDRILSPGRVVIDGDRVVDVGPGAEAGAFAGQWIVPGFIDVHVHGVLGHDTLAAPGSVAAIAAHLPRFGCTSFTPTTFACPPDRLEMLAMAIEAAMDAPAAESARVLPAHLESNFMAPDYRGAQPLAQLCLPPGAPADAATPGTATDFTAQDILGVIERHRRAIGKLTLAPELPAALALIRSLVGQGHRVSLGHSGATLEEAQAGIDAGARQATHLFNRMPAFTHRAPGLVGAVLDDDRVDVELVSDGFHVHPVTMRAAIRAKRPERVMAITDGLAGAGLAVGERFELGGRGVTVREQACFLDDGTLAGSRLTMDRVFANLVGMIGLTPVEAALMTATVPARAHGLSDRGRIAEGLLADLVVLDAGWRVRQTLVGGAVVFADDPANR
ncbi:N-acetylglucosamine-6-phosphate deacetylase [Luteitalea sp. TBR-22]|uniref:N-acetylglucosamine-6-phosphate deacetylase n=1 Tax=Luteitalea sp. TBR-22 TaxID=2802971 RepID=UPI001AF05C8E|nr:N-acetylglucosamine-6-phosphate deacetylase [Luteitalea sp. TBR-22]BCS31601.1 N-acetylglucosamine-6-phosphate deacetylase [Luteitalea sp. TBR-22]